MKLRTLKLSILLAFVLSLFLTILPAAAFANDGYIYGYFKKSLQYPNAGPTDPWVNNDLYHARDAIWRTNRGCYAWGGGLQDGNSWPIVDTGWPDMTEFGYNDANPPQLVDTSGGVLGGNPSNVSKGDVFYANTHGAPGSFEDSYWHSIGADLIYSLSNQKHFAYLDACDTVDDRTLSDAFFIVPSLTGPNAFLGWRGARTQDGNYCWFTEIIWDNLSGAYGPKESLYDSVRSAYGATGITNWGIYGNQNIYL